MSLADIYKARQMEQELANNFVFRNTIESLCFNPRQIVMEIPNNGTIYFKAPIEPDYKFKVTSTNKINFDKIADDLTYADPLRIVTAKFVNDKGEQQVELFSVVHHTILDKFNRSKDIGETNFHPSCLSLVRDIKQEDIKDIVKGIKAIKRLEWQKDSEIPNVNVEVMRVKI